MSIVAPFPALTKIRLNPETLNEVAGLYRKPGGRKRESDCPTLAAWIESRRDSVLRTADRPGVTGGRGGRGDGGDEGGSKGGAGGVGGVGSAGGGARGGGTGGGNTGGMVGGVGGSGGVGGEGGVSGGACGGALGDGGAGGEGNKGGSGGGEENGNSKDVEKLDPPASICASRPNPDQRAPFHPSPKLSTRSSEQVAPPVAWRWAAKGAPPEREAPSVHCTVQLTSVG